MYHSYRYFHTPKSTTIGTEKIVFFPAEVFSFSELIIYFANQIIIYKNYLFFCKNKNVSKRHFADRSY